MPYLVIIIGVLLIVGFVIAVPAFRASSKAYKETGKRPKGYYLNQGIAIGMALGIPLGLAMDNIGIGPALGLPIGIAIGTAQEKKHEAELRELTDEEKSAKTKSLYGLVAMMLIGVIAFFAVVYFGLID